MLSYVDCLGMSDLDEGDVEMLALDNHLPTIVALEYGNFLLHCPGGVVVLQQRFNERLITARLRHDWKKVHRLELLLEHLHNYALEHLDDPKRISSNH